MSLNDGAAVGDLLEPRAQRDRVGHVDVEREREVGRGRLRLGHPPRDRLLQARELLDSRRSPLAPRGRRGCGCRRAARAWPARVAAARLGRLAPAAVAGRGFARRPSRSARPGPCPPAAPARRRARAPSAARPARPSRASPLPDATVAGGCALALAGWRLVRAARSARARRRRRRRAPPLRRRCVSAGCSLVGFAGRRRRCAARRRRSRGLARSPIRAITSPIGKRVALLGDDLDQRAVGVGLVGHVRLVGLDLDQLLAARDLVARGCLSHFRIVPSSIESDRRGMTTSVAKAISSRGPGRSRARPGRRAPRAGRRPARAAWSRASARRRRSRAATGASS